jgi:hypothetical protein
MRIPPRFRKKSLAHAGLVSSVTLFEAIRASFAPSLRCFDRDVKNQGQVRFQASGRHPANLPQEFRIETAGVSLVNHISQEKAIGNNDVPGVQSRTDDFCSELRPAGHEQKRFTRDRHFLVAIQEQFANRLSNRCTARIGARRNGMATVTKPIGQQTALG